jgi:squalene-hopene/tetraprenyl-beta-curcumene cyclase
MDAMTRRRFFLTGTAGLAAGVVPTRFGVAAPTAKVVDALADKAHVALKSLQNEDGSFAPKLGGPGITALVAAGLIRTGKKPDDPVVAKALAYLEKNVQKDGGIYAQRLANYATCVSLMAFKEANAGGKYDAVIGAASKFLKGLQQGDDTPETDGKYGGVGYDGRSRPDLSNTHFFIDALLAAGVSKDDPAVKKAVVYVGRCQNLKSEFNTLAFAEKATADDKGGFVYTPTEAEGKKGGKGGGNVTPNGGLRSYGSMSYAGLKSLLYAGVTKDDPRVKAALDWIKRHYTVAENPGHKDSGLFYYFHLFAKAMDALGEDTFTDAKGVKHDWRPDLFGELKKRQKADGVWANANGAFQEGTPELATAFALLALSYCKPK